MPSVLYFDFRLYGIPLDIVSHATPARCETEGPTTMTDAVTCTLATMLAMIGQSPRNGDREPFVLPLPVLLPFPLYIYVSLCTIKCLYFYIRILLRAQTAPDSTCTLLRAAREGNTKLVLCPLPRISPTTCPTHELDISIVVLDTG